MPRHKNFDWNLPEGRHDPTSNSNVHEHQNVHSALLMDIRDELRELNATLGCYRLMRMAEDIHRIDRRLAETKPLPKGRPKKETP